MGDPTPLDLEAIQRYFTNPSTLTLFTTQICLLFTVCKIIRTRSRIQELAQIRSDCHEDGNLIASDEDDLLRECVLQLEGKVSQIIEEYSDVSSLQPEDLDTYLENLKGGLCSLEAENDKLSDEIGSLMKAYLEGSIQLQSNIEGLSSSLEFIQSEGFGTKRAEHQPKYEGAHDDCMFKILELNGQIEKKKGMLKSLEDLDYNFKRFEGFLKIEDTLTGLEVIEYEGSRINLSLRTFIPEIEMPEQNHELAIEILEGSLELKNAEIFPNDVYIGEIIDVAKSFEHQFSLLPMSENKTSLEWFIRRIQDKIVLSTLRKSLVKDASKSRYSIEYVDRDEMIVAHMVDEVDAFIKVSQGWPMATSPLKLISLKGSSQTSTEVTFSFLCKVEEMVNSLDVQVCQNISTLVDAIEEIFKQRMRIEIQSNTSINK
ncbi:hypothetical protein L1987_67304 [Smallanthus sonchifolius]|uniref:Uncharacterized protein n=1 Tax=Smallanthus sonchifolius TaxID=185202 RepID=A0ACB9B3P2_9ASTR|nr:hypothetical protein L1987_67304 [Smallanthus sonchifolius]